MLTKPKKRNVAAVLALCGVVIPGLHKFYLGEPKWGAFYLLLSPFNPIAKIASVIEGIWYLTQRQEEFDRNFNTLSAQDSPQATIDPTQIEAIAHSLRQLDQLREDGLVSEYEFEQKRRQLLDQIGK
ncbi:MAG: NINE protein [Leptolyngbyaceae cyanobacterium SL_7_1]|nr:NINE protein [Leptolyngbyaceae cyanobacterium SL_7_1]